LRFIEGQQEAAQLQQKAERRSEHVSEVWIIDNDRLLANCRPWEKPGKANRIRPKAVIDRVRMVRKSIGTRQKEVSAGDDETQQRPGY
jgi:hypothetical protein